MFSDRDRRQHIGTTPFFYEVPRSRQLDLWAGSSDSQCSLWSRNRCSVRWAVAGFGNLPLLALRPEAGIAAIAYDFISGNAWHCPDRIRIEIPRKSVPSLDLHETCLRFFVIPPGIEDRDLSFSLVEAWKKKLSEQLLVCHSFVESEETQDIHRILNIGFHKKFDYEKISRHKILKIGAWTGADFLVSLSPDPTDYHVILADYYDIHRDEKVPDRYPAKVRLEEAVPESSVLKELWSRFFYELFPNSIAYESRVVRHSQDSFHEHRSEINTLPRVLSSFSFMNVISPYAFDTWDLAFGLSPGMNLYAFDWRYRYDPDSAESDRWKLFYILPSFEGRVVFFTAIGQLSFGLGAGPAMVVSTFNNEPSRYLSGVFSLSYVRYEAHLNRSLFVYSDFSSYKIKPYITEHHLKSGSFSEVSVGLGYFFRDLNFWRF